MRKLLYILPVLLILGLAACENYVDITPTGKKTVDSTDTYYELVALPNRCYHPASFALLSDNVWSKESNIIGKEYLSWDGINMTFNEEAVRKDLSDNNLYANCYTYILRSNIVISLVDHSTGDKDMKELAKAEAKIMRAWDHFILVNTFAKSYHPETAATDGGVAIVRDYDLEATPTKATVAEVYDFIIKDIEEALPYLQEEPVNVYHPSKAFGYALAARVYLFHRDWEKAEEAAEESLKRNNALIDYIALEADGGPTVVTTYARGGNPEILNYAHMGGVTEYMSYTYGMISPELIQLFGANDERMNLFFKTTGNPEYYFDEGSGAALWNTLIGYTKFQYMAVGMRTAEVYLILAEAKARQNDLSGAVEVLNRLREKRIKGTEAVLPEPATQREMMQEIINERRKELLFGFSRFWDLKRFNTEPDYAKTITRVFPLVSTNVEQKTYTLKPDSRLYVIPFPLAAREKNPNLTLNTNE
jgi:tetratricopeptide (TPR) repeat protein